MRALIRAAARLYPRRWRARYAREFDALLEELEPNWLDQAFLQRAQQADADESSDVKRRAAVSTEVPVDPKTRSTMLTVSFADRNPEKARQVTERLLGSVLTANGIPSGSIRTARTGPNRPLVAGTGGTVGLMVGALLMWFRREPTSER